MRKLEEDWQKILSTIESPSTRMLLTQQAKLIEVRPTAISFFGKKKLLVRISITSNWTKMIQARLSILEEACKQAYQSPVRVELIEG